MPFFKRKTKPEAVPVSGKDAYYRAAAQWDAELVRSVRVSRNRAYAMAGVSWLVTLALAGALAVVTGRSAIQVVTIAYDDATQTVRQVRYNVAEAQKLTSLDAVKKFHVNQWLVALETKSAADMPRRAQLLNLQTTEALGSRLKASFVGDAADLALGTRLQRTVKVFSIALLKPEVAYVQFATQDFVDGVAVQNGTREWASTVEFKFSNQPSDDGDLINPFGFVVTNYRRDASSAR